MRFAPSDTFLGGLTEEEQDELLARSRRRDVEADEVLIGEGEVDGNVYIVLSGSVSISRRTAGGGTLELGTRGVGELLGELGALDAAPRSATVTAAERTEVAALVASELLTFVSSHPHLAVKMIQSLARRLRQSEARSAGFAPIDMSEVLGD